MRRLLLISVLLCSSGCGFLLGPPALRPLEFTFVRVSDVNLAGVTLVGKTSYADLTRTDVTQLTAGLIGEDVPTTIAIHLRVENPNSVEARMVNLGWTFYFEDTKVRTGRLEKAYEIDAGQAVDVVVPMTFNAHDLNQRNTQDLFYLGLALVGLEGYAKTMSLDLAPIAESERGLLPSTEPIRVSRVPG